MKKKKTDKEIEKDISACMSERWLARCILDKTYQYFESIQNEPAPVGGSHLSLLSECFERAEADTLCWMQNGFERKKE